MSNPSNGQMTPAPWHFSPEGTRNVNGWWQAHVKVGCSEDPRVPPGNTIAIVYHGGNGATGCDREGIEANARLISAAPELLKALKDLVDLMQDFGECDCAVNEENRATCPTHNGLRAIAKAEGRQE